MRPRQLVIPAEVAGRRVLADRGALVVTVTFYLLVSTVLSALWRAASGATGDVAGYSGTALTWYIFTTEAAVCALNIRLIEEVGEDIGSGDVAVELLRPLPMLAVRLADEMGRALPRLAILLAVGAAAAWLLVGPPPQVGAALLAVPALVLAVAVNLVFQYAVAASAFWLRDSRSAWFLYQKLVFILGGMLLPIQVLPPVLRSVALHLPFPSMAYAPARLAAGFFEPGLLVVQAAWVVVVGAAAAAIFVAGQRRLQVVGG